MFVADRAVKETLIDRALNSAAEAQMVRLFDTLVLTENVPNGITLFERKLRELVTAYDTAAALIVELKAERAEITPAKEKDQ
jgi:hypothetical protein